MYSDQMTWTFHVTCVGVMTSNGSEILGYVMSL